MSLEHSNAMSEIRPDVMNAFYDDELKRWQATHFQENAQEATA